MTEEKAGQLLALDYGVSSHRERARLLSQLDAILEPAYNAGEVLQVSNPLMLNTERSAPVLVCCRLQQSIMIKIEKEKASII